MAKAPLRNGRAGGEGKFAGIPNAVIETRKYAALSGWAVKLLLELAAQYNGPGSNNGDLCAPYDSIMRRKGWRSKGTLNRALRELLDAGFIIKTRQGGRKQCSLYALAWKPIDECLDRQTKQPKHNVAPTVTAPGTWRDDAEAAA